MAEHDLGGAIRRTREHRGMTLRQLATALEVSVGTMSAIENNKVAVTVERLNAIATHLDITAAALLRTEIVAIGSVDSQPGEWRRFDDLGLHPVLAAAVEVFTETGYHGATMRLVAGAAGISVAGIYHHHRSKQHLLVALFDAMLNEVQWRTSAAARQGTDPASSFALMVEALALCHTQRRDLAFIATTEMRSLEQPDRTRIAGLRRRIQQQLDDVALTAVSTGAFTTSTPHSTGRAIATMCMALPHWFSPIGPHTGAEVAAEYATLALRMMGHSSSV
ncbi:MAG: TetR family transcriptional regulator [Gordonia sp. (in: high G+C Gram-positive bacteria)]